VTLIDGSKNDADNVAKLYNLTNYGPIWNESNYFVFIHPGLKYFSFKPDRKINQLLAQDKQVKWFEQQKVQKQITHRFNKLSKKSELDDVYVDIRNTNGAQMMFNDPLFPNQWYINGMEDVKYSLNVRDAWEQGFTGKGVVVSILDDGIKSTHPDLIDNYDHLASANLIHDLGMDGFGFPTLNKHGTRCAGEIASTANNYICGVGIAYNSKIGGINMLTKLHLAAIEAIAFSFNYNYIDIFSVSWGPVDDGVSFGGPSTISKEAIQHGIKYGRHGLGSIYVWAAGNGGKYDNCNADGYVNSLYVITVSSANQYGFAPDYVEECSSILTTTFSSKSLHSKKEGIVTTDFIMSRDACIKTAGGTSASAPIAAGIIALALEAK